MEGVTLSTVAQDLPSHRPQPACLFLAHTS